MKLSEYEHKRMREEMFNRLANQKMVYPSDIERRKSPREFGMGGKCKNHKRNNKKRR